MPIAPIYVTTTRMSNEFGKGDGNENGNEEGDGNEGEKHLNS
jgi:hypothetical protein